MDLVECIQCGEDYPSVACRWRCPSCGYKDSCCDGEAQPKGGRFTQSGLERPTHSSRPKLSGDDYVDF
jgi:hypothetical protein